MPSFKRQTERKVSAQAVIRKIKTFVFFLFKTDGNILVYVFSIAVCKAFCVVGNGTMRFSAPMNFTSNGAI
jgi:hypothetical protein